jgi:flagellar hook assembly protein FlgD
VLPAQSHVAITIYNILGQEVASLLDEDQMGGRHSVEWNGRSTRGVPVSSGVYFYRIEAKRTGGWPLFAEVKKMLLVK